MTRDDAEITELRAKVNCAALLERLPPPWKLDRPESTRNCLKYRRGAGEILIVNHQGRGWWNPLSDAKGDAFGLLQHLDPTLNFGHARKLLREFIGLTPSFPEAPRSGAKNIPEIPIAEKWDCRPALCWNTAAWRYLNRERRIPAKILVASSGAGCVRVGAYGSPWFAYRDATGGVTHIEIRGRDYKGSVKGGTKTLFQFPAGQGPLTRLVLAEAPIDALSLAAIECARDDTLYAATGGGMGPATIQTIQTILARMTGHTGAILCSATDADAPGERHAARHHLFAHDAGIAFRRMRPPDGHIDWNDVLVARRTQP